MRRGAALLAFGAAMLSIPSSAPAQTVKPNVVLIVMDDVGYGDYGSYGAPDVRTPNIDSLAKAGTRFTDFYAAPSCSPTRAALISGRYQQRYRIEVPLRGSARGTADQGLRPTGRSLPQLLKNNGYRTALIGKWHLGYTPELGPNAHGFDYFFGFKSGFIDYYQHTDRRGTPTCSRTRRAVRVDGYSTDLFTERSIRFIEEHAGRRSSSSWPTTPRTGRSRCRTNRRWRPTTAGSCSRRSTGEHPRRLRRACSSAPITGVGQILAALERARPDPQHAGDLHQRQRRRMAVAQRAAVPSQADGLGRRHPRAGSSCSGQGGIPAGTARRARSASSWT